MLSHIENRYFKAGAIVALICFNTLAGPVFETAQDSLEVASFEVGVKLFSDRAYVLTDEVPASLLAMDFIRSPINSAGSLGCQQAGEIYALTPAERDGAATQIAALEEIGFVLQTEPEFQLFGANAIDRVVLYKKTVESGETLSLGKWTVLLAPELTLVPKPIEMETLYNGIELESDPRNRTDMSAYGSDPLPVPYLYTIHLKL